MASLFQIHADLLDLFVEANKLQVKEWQKSLDETHGKKSTIQHDIHLFEASLKSTVQKQFKKVPDFNIKYIPALLNFTPATYTESMHRSIPSSSVESLDQFRENERTNSMFEGLDDLNRLTFLQDDNRLQSVAFVGSQSNLFTSQLSPEVRAS